MKSIAKFLLKQFGYRLTKINFYENWVNIDNARTLDFYHFFKNIVNTEKIVCCFDIGANIGQTAKKLQGYFPNATIYCFEPVHLTYEQLKVNMEQYPNIRTYNVGLGASKGEIEIFHREDSEWNSLVDQLNKNEKISGATSEYIKVDTIDHFVKEQNIAKIAILKSDTEGFELEVLKGARYCLENQLIDFLYLEVGFNSLDLQHAYVTTIIETLENYGYGFSGLFEMSYTEQHVILYANALFCKRAGF